MRAILPPTRHRAHPSAPAPGTARSTWRWTASPRCERRGLGVFGRGRHLRTAMPQQKTAAGKPAAALQEENRKEASVLGRPGSDLLFQVLRLSTIGAGKF